MTKSKPTMNIVNVSVMKDSFLAVWCSSVVVKESGEHAKGPGATLAASLGCQWDTVNKSAINSCLRMGKLRRWATTDILSTFSAWIPLLHR